MRDYTMKSGDIRKVQKAYKVLVDTHSELIDCMTLLDNLIDQVLDDGSVEREPLMDAINKLWLVTTDNRHGFNKQADAVYKEFDNLLANIL